MSALHPSRNRPVSSRLGKGAAAALLLGASACDHPTPQEKACESLAGRTVEGVTLAGARLVAASGAVPEYCEVTGTLPPSLDFEVRLPSAWNDKTLFIGGGGFDGSIPSANGYTARGYASIASNGGHAGSALDGSFASDPVKFDDFADLSTHRVLPVAKAVIREHYGRNSARTWFEGCSNGGREALIEAQRWPEDFDGIIARAPAYNFVELFLTFNRHAQQLSQPGAALPKSKLEILGRAVLEACDAKDGLTDGIISNPAACQFDPTVLQCPGAEGDNCLTAPQVESVKTIYSPYLINGERLNEGWPPGGEADPDAWSLWTTGNGNTAFAGGTLFAQDLIRYFITQDPAYDALSFQATDWLSRIDEVSTRVSALDADLSRFRARGGKLILWHGGTDAAISQKGTEAYYEKVRQTAGGQEAADTFVEYFPAPGVNHCAGGAGPDNVDLIPALEAWVEGGPPPSQAGLVIRKLTSTGASTLARPLCKYPRYPKHNGAGDAALAESFTCVEP